LTPVAVETTFTPPDCSVPPTVIDDDVIAKETVGSVAAGALPAAIRLTETRRPCSPAKAASGRSRAVAWDEDG